MSDVLREVDVPIMSNDECNNVYGLIADGHICTDSARGKGTCYVRKIQIEHAMLSKVTLPEL